MKLYAMPGTCALAPNVALQWAEADYELALMQHGDQQRPEFLRVNPLGKVPALVLDDGRILTEAAAILNWIGDTYPQARLGGEDADRRYEINQWLSFMTSDVHASAFGPHFAPQRFHPDEAQHETVRATAHERLAGLYRELDKRLDGRTHPVGDRPTVVDAYLFVLTLWSDMTPVSLDDLTGLKAFRERMEADAGVRRALELQGMKG
jgi:glutathione S-transferase